MIHARPTAPERRGLKLRLTGFQIALYLSHTRDSRSDKTDVQYRIRRKLWKGDQGADVSYSAKELELIRSIFEQLEVENSFLPTSASRGRMRAARDAALRVTRVLEGV